MAFALSLLALRVVPPLYVLAPVSATMPELVLTIEPLPLITPVNVPVTGLKPVLVSCSDPEPLREPVDERLEIARQVARPAGDGAARSGRAPRRTRRGEERNQDLMMPDEGIALPDA